MNLIELFKRIKPYVYPYRWLVLITLILSLIGSLMAQVNAIVLDRTVDAIATEQIKASPGSLTATSYMPSRTAVSSSLETLTAYIRKTAPEIIPEPFFIKDCCLL